MLGSVQSSALNWGSSLLKDKIGHSAAAATFGLINSIGQLGGFAGPYVIGFLNERTHSLIASFGFIALVYVAAASLILSLRIRDPI